MTDTTPSTTPGPAPEQGTDGPPPATAPPVPEERLRSLLNGTELREWLAGVSCAESGAAEALLRHLVETP